MTDVPFRFPPMTDEAEIALMLEDWGPYLFHPDTDAQIPESDGVGGLVEEGMYDAFMEGWQAGRRAFAKGLTAAQLEELGDSLCRQAAKMGEGQ